MDPSADSVELRATVDQEDQSTYEPTESPQRSCKEVHAAGQRQDTTTDAAASNGGEDPADDELDVPLPTPPVVSAQGETKLPEVAVKISDRRDSFPDRVQSVALSTVKSHQVAPVGADGVDQPYGPAAPGFVNWCKALGIRPAAAQEWHDIAKRPVLSMSICFGSYTGFIVVMLVTFVVASPGVAYRHILAYVASGTMFCTMVAQWQWGPVTYARRAKPVVGLFGLIFFAPIVSGLLSIGTSSVPYGSEIIFIAVLSVMWWFSFLAAMWTCAGDQMLVRHMSFLAILWCVSVRCLKVMDGLSDAGLAISAIAQAMACEDSGKVDCAAYRRLAVLAGAMALADLTLAVVVTMLGKEYEQRDDARARRTLLIALFCSAVCEGGMLVAHSLIAAYQPQRPNRSVGLSMELYISFSASTTLLCLLANLIGAGRIFRLLRAVAVRVPVPERAKAALSGVKAAASKASGFMLGASSYTKGGNDRRSSPCRASESCSRGPESINASFHTVVDHTIVDSPHASLDRCSHHSDDRNGVLRTFETLGQQHAPRQVGRVDEPERVMPLDARNDRETIAMRTAFRDAVAIDISQLAAVV